MFAYLAVLGSIAIPVADAVPAETALAVASEPVPRAHAPISAAAAGLSRDLLMQAEEAVRAEAQRGGFPGATLAIGRRDRVAVEAGYGYVGWNAGDLAVDADYTVYDLASLTKVVATTTASMLLVEDGRMDLDAPVSTYLPAFSGGRKDQVTVRHLLTHTSGLPAGDDLWGGPERALAKAVSLSLQAGPGTWVEYSDIGMVVLWAAAERAAGESLPELLERRVFRPLAMRSTGFRPPAGCERCAPTFRSGDGRPAPGVVHDPIARVMAGISGNAGLFSTAHDLGRFAAMLANGGELEGVRVLRPETIRLFTERQPGSRTRALGWDTPPVGRVSSAGRRISPQGFGHTGFTGTSIWIDPERGTWVVLLSNRVFEPRAPTNRITSVRARVNDLVAEAADRAGASGTGEVAAGS